jgi:transposase
MPSMPVQVLPSHSDGTADEVVLGVDTHKELHAAAVISSLGVLLAARTFPATGAGYRDLVSWARNLGPLQRAGVECTGSCGAGLSRHLLSAGIAVIEVSQPDRATRRRRGKTDAIDAESAARAVLAGQATASAKAGDGPVEMIRMFKLAKASAIKARTQAINQLKAVLVGADPALREKLSGLSSTILVRRCAQLDTRVPADVTSAAAYTLRLLACRILSLASEVRELEQHIADAVLAHTPQLTQQQGIGPDSAAALLITAGDNPGRLHSEASFAALCGVSPVEASSGRTSRRRLNRGGDRQANAALYRIALSRLRWDQPTRQYMDKRITEGKTKREAMRCLKRYIAREVYHLITTPTPTPEPQSGP